MSQRKLSRQQRRRIEKTQGERARRAQQREAADTSDAAYGDEEPGRVVAHFGRHLEVEDSHGQRYRCHLRANLEPLVTGDHVSWRRGSDGSGVVEARLPRRSTLARPDARGRLRDVAANIDRILIVLAVEPEPHPFLIDRYLVAAEATGITPALVLNKLDLLGDDHPLHALAHRYRTLGYAVIGATTRREEGLTALAEVLLDVTAVFVGQSGVGKSSLIDALLPDAELRIGELSLDSRKGRHTTTTARLYHFREGKGALIDSPGIRDFGLGHLDEREIEAGFVEFRPYLGHCRFRDCHHRREPGCAILAAVENGDIAAERLESFRHIVDEVQAG
ncbi:small ribosomal subunit biogenesis GTPase RsgA [Kushneria aurantia]|uniref:Small ribosomal subunit biogenesis GTPase RsgA n=1 Tax=Kushneria aurantia TaxID=504092 RepID=A0ABV6G716_9GAMM|nr:small ribosomal subunit biogenesis GTPase RsgA [Kushneria aurantia]